MSDCYYELIDGDDERGERFAATELVRDLVNTPAEDMGPAELETVAAGLAKRDSIHAAFRFRPDHPSAERRGGDRGA